MLLSTDIYEDAQFQAEAPIGEQKPIPIGVHDIELSWDRKKGYMRIIINGEKWWFKEYLGKAQVLGTNSDKGHINLQAMARLDGETLTMYRAPDAIPHRLVEGEERSKTHNRLCYRRAGREWRLRDERMPWNHPDALVLVKSYVGDMNAEWAARDSIAHIYHNGWTVIANGVCHLYDPDLLY